MAKGEISNNNILMSFVIPKELKIELSKIAAKEHRSMSNLIVNLVDNYVYMNKQQERLTKYQELISRINEGDAK